MPKIFTDTTMRVRGIEALTDDRCPFGRVGRDFGVTDIRRAPVGAIGQRRGAAPGHGSDGNTQPGQVGGEGASGLTGAEYYVQPICTHDRVLSLNPREPWRSATAQPRRSVTRTLRWFQKTSNRFLE